jgi:hypothetical protein
MSVSREMDFLLSRLGLVRLGSPVCRINSNTIPHMRSKSTPLVHTILRVLPRFMAKLVSLPVRLSTSPLTESPRGNCQILSRKLLLGKRRRPGSTLRNRRDCSSPRTRRAEGFQSNRHLYWTGHSSNSATLCLGAMLINIFRSLASAFMQNRDTTAGRHILCEDFGLGWLCSCLSSLTICVAISCILAGFNPGFRDLILRGIFYAETFGHSLFHLSPFTSGFGLLALVYVALFAGRRPNTARSAFTILLRKRPRACTSLPQLRGSFRPSDILPRFGKSGTAPLPWNLFFLFLAG